MTDRKVCVITGASSGIGAATALLYASRGWNVVINYSRNVARGEDVGRACRAAGVEALVLKADVSSDQECRKLAAEVEASFGRVQVLINNAGITKFSSPKNLDGLNASDFHRVYAVNLIGAFQMSRALLPLMRKASSVDGTSSGLVNISSVASMLGVGSSLAYMASKGALNAFTVGLARALAPAVRVNAIAPGMVDSPWLKEGMGADGFRRAEESYRKRAVLGEIISPEDVAEAAWWFGATASKITGEVLLLDAGFKLTR